MNIFYFHTHDIGRYISPYGYHLYTPALLQFAKEGTLFRNAHCAAPTCSPSRAALLTGMYPHCNGMMGLAHRGFSITDYRTHLSHYLRENGFQTALFGIQHETEEEKIQQTLGYETVYTNKRDKCLPSEKDYAVTEAFCDFLKKRADKRPLFVSMGLGSTHRRYEKHNITNPNYVRPPHLFPDNEITRNDFADYADAVRVVDECVGKALGTVKKLSYDKNSIIIFTTDHGIAFPMMKCNLNDSGTGVSLIMNFPENPSRGKVSDSLISQIDVFPTLCDILGLQEPEYLQGKSFKKVFENTDAEINESIFSEVTYHAGYEPKRTVRSKRYRYIRLYEDETSLSRANIDEGLTKGFLDKYGFFDFVRQREMLFDTFLDPDEKVNLVYEKNYSEILDVHRKILDEHMQKTNDPLLDGEIYAKGAVVSKKWKEPSDLDKEVW